MRYEVSCTTLTKTFEDRIALANMRTKKFYVLNFSASLIWKRICDGETRDKIEDGLRRQFQISVEESASALDQLLSVLLNEDFITIQP